MKVNRFNQLLRENKIPIGHMLSEFATRGIAQMLEAASIDFVVVDMEHTGFSTADIANLMAWFKATNVAPFVRIPQTEYHFIARTLDAGALGVMVPNVRTSAEARAIVDAAKYASLGKRGLGAGANTDFKNVDHKQFWDHSNRNTTIICQIESQEGLENLEGIAATPGIDVLWVGHFDLTQSMGILAQFHHERFVKALKMVVNMARKYNLGAGIQPRTMTQVCEWLEVGFNVISFADDIQVYVESLSQTIKEVRNLTREKGV